MKKQDYLKLLIALLIGLAIVLVILGSVSWLSKQKPSNSIQSAASTSSSVAQYKTSEGFSLQKEFTLENNNYKQFVATSKTVSSNSLFNFATNELDAFNCGLKEGTWFVQVFTDQNLTDKLYDMEIDSSGTPSSSLLIPDANVYCYVKQSIVFTKDSQELYLPVNYERPASATQSRLYTFNKPIGVNKIELNNLPLR
jgi:hypothetical protein